MGLFLVGGVEKHLAALKDAAAKWLEHERPSINKTTGGSGFQDLLSLSTEDVTEVPEPPEALLILRESRHFNVPVYDAPILMWPYLLRQELIAVINTEQEHEAKLAANLKLQLESGQIGKNNP